MNIVNKKSILLFLAFSLFFFVASAQTLTVSQSATYIQTDKGEPFLWLGDTAWELFHKLNREDAQMYLRDRADKGFTIVQAVVLAEMDGLRSPNAYGEIPLIDMDPTQPNEAYFQHVDFIVNEAAKLGLFIAMLPTWGDKVTPAHGGEPVIFNTTNAFHFGNFLGSRYATKPIVWILGGDRNVENETELEVWRALASGLEKGGRGVHLISYHPRGPHSSHEKLHNEPWLDFNMYQSGHSNRYRDVYNFAETLEAVRPRKPFVDAEPPYEDIAVEFWKYCDWSTKLKVPEDVLGEDHTVVKKEYFAKGFFDDHDIRVHAYWNFLSGAAGYTYGNNAIWQMFEKGSGFAIPCLTDWREALDRPGARQIQFLKRIFTLYPISDFRADQSIIVGNNPKDSTHIRAAIGHGNSFILTYASQGQPININVDKIGRKARAYWYDPRIGEFLSIKKMPNRGTVKFMPPSMGRGNDWLLVLDNRGLPHLQPKANPALSR